MKNTNDEGDYVIALMGLTGTGKSTFIETATEQDGSTIGHSLASKTVDIQTVRVRCPGRARYVCFVDTPGFDDTTKTDIEVLVMIAEFLMTKHKDAHNKLTGILYLHRISDTRMGGSPLRQLQVFANMCGTSGLPNVVLLSTMWNLQDGNTPGGTSLLESRESELIQTFWKPLLDCGATTRRFEGTTESAWSVVNHLLSKAESQSKVVNQLPEEMVDARLRLPETASGRTLQQQLQKLLDDRNAASQKLRAMAASKASSPMVVHELNRREEEIRTQIESVSGQLGQLKVSIQRRFQLVFKNRKPIIDVTSSLR